MRVWVKDFGAWSDTEIAAWTDAEVNALFIQFVSGDMRAAFHDNEVDDEAWDAYDADDNASHNIFRAGDGTIYFSLCR